jgi:hypothetical protein
MAALPKAPASASQENIIAVPPIGAAKGKRRSPHERVEGEIGREQ